MKNHYLKKKYPWCLVWTITFDFNVDVTQYQGVQLHPDVAHHPSASVQPDLMPQNNFQVMTNEEQTCSLVQCLIPGNFF